MEWLAVSLVLSVILTIVANVALRMFPRAGERMSERLEEYARREPDEPPRSGVRVIFPWKAMIIGSIVLTIVLNLVFWLR